MSFTYTDPKIHHHVGSSPTLSFSEKAKKPAIQEHERGQDQGYILNDLIDI